MWNIKLEHVLKLNKSILVKNEYLFQANGIKILEIWLKHLLNSFSILCFLVTFKISKLYFQQSTLHYFTEILVQSINLHGLKELCLICNNIICVGQRILDWGYQHYIYTTIHTESIGVLLNEFQAVAMKNIRTKFFLSSSFQ